MPDPIFYGADLAAIHDTGFGDLACRAAAYLRSLLDEADLRQGTVVDLGCGSGILARELTGAGYDVLGVDISQDLLDLASANAPKASFHRGSLLDVDLPRAVAVTAIGEGLNYATDPRAGIAELERLASRVHEALAPRGVFLFDVAAPGRHGPDRIANRYHDHDDWTLSMRGRRASTTRPSIGASRCSAGSRQGPAAVDAATSTTCCGSTNRERSSTRSSAQDSRPRSRVRTARRPRRRRPPAGRS